MVAIPSPEQSLLAPEQPAPLSQQILLEGVSWNTYKALLDDLGDHRASRLAYGQGVLEITMPSDLHETRTKLLERMIEALTEELDLPIKGFRSTTLNREDLRQGAEPDSCFYIQNVGRIQGRTLNLDRDPPPDLILEVYISSPSKKRMEIYQQMGVPEIWRYVKGEVKLYQLQDDRYEIQAVSPSFPFVSAEQINRFLTAANAQDDNGLIRDWRCWIRKIQSG